jgi:hypothetical protein
MRVHKSLTILLLLLIVSIVPFSVDRVDEKDSMQHLASRVLNNNLIHARNPDAHNGDLQALVSLSEVDLLKEIVNIPISNPIPFQIVNDTLFIIDDFTGLITYDISDIVHPEMLGTYRMTNGSRLWAREIIVEENVAYIANQTALLALDITDPQNPSLLDYLDTSDNYIRSASIEGDYLYIGGGHFTIVNITEPTNIQVVPLDRC